MIFITVGTQLPFDRLIKAVDAWAALHPEVEVFAQIGPSELKPAHIESVPFIAPDEADRRFRAADLIVSHAGMGSIITALKYKKPILILPRMAGLGEHRNDHQMATAKWLGVRRGITVAWTEQDVPRYLEGEFELSQTGEISDSADPGFIDNLRSAILSEVSGAAVPSRKLTWSWLRH